MDQIGFELAEDSLHFTDLSGELSLVSQQVSLGPITGKLNQNAFTLGGSLYNLIPFLNDTSEKFVGELVLDSPILNLSTLSSKKESSSAIKMPDRMHLYLECRIGMLEMNPYRLGDFEADFELKNKKLTGRDLSFKAFGGDFSGDVFFEEKEQFYTFQTLAQLSKVKIDELFLTANNFQQDFIKSNQLKGLLSSDLRLSFQLDKKGKLIVKSIKIESDVTIANGELIGLKSLEALSKYIELEELKHIRFKNLQNQLLVQDCTITIPRFNIQSSALNFSLAGSHHFNTTIDYHIVLLLSDVLRKKVKKPKASEYGYIADDGLGQTKVFLKMTGSSDKPEFAYDKTELKSHLRQEVQNEKKTIKGLLNKEFGLFKNDSTIKDTEPSTKQKTSPFQIDWEENPDKNETEQGNEPKKKAEKKGKFGKFIDKIAKPNEDEYERPKNN